MDSRTTALTRHGRAGSPRPVLAIVPPMVRDRVAAALGSQHELHCILDLQRAAEAAARQPPDVVLLSPSTVHGQDRTALRRLLARRDGALHIAMVCEHGPGSTKALLELGALGVSNAVDVTSPEGWAELRNTVASTDSLVAARTLRALTAAVGDVPIGLLRFLDTLIRRSPELTTVREMAVVLTIHSSTLVSRFGRAGLPSPKEYLVATRLLYVASMLEHDGATIGSVAYRLRYASPQSLGRHMRAQLGVTPSEFRERVSFTIALERYIGRFYASYAEILRQFNPLGYQPRGARLHRRPDDPT